MNTNQKKKDRPAIPATTGCAGHDSGLTHLDASGAVHMVDVGAKPITTRTARAEAVVIMQPETLTRLIADDLPKGDAPAAIRLAGIMAAKRTADLIPLCHPLPLDHVSVTLTSEKPNRLRIETLVRTTGRTGVEMEALTAATAAALTAYDMCKAIDRGMEISTVRLLEKSGGRSGHWHRQPERPDRLLWKDDDHEQEEQHGTGNRDQHQ